MFYAPNYNSKHFQAILDNTDYGIERFSKFPECGEGLNILATSTKKDIVDQALYLPLQEVEVLLSIKNRLRKIDNKLYYIKNRGGINEVANDNRN